MYPNTTTLMVIYRIEKDGTYREKLWKGKEDRNDEYTVTTGPSLYVRNDYG